MRSMRLASSRTAAVAVLALLLLGIVAVTPASAADATALNPTTGPAGTQVAITGTFTLPITSVTFNGQTATIVGTPTATTVLAIVPPAATTGNVVVTDGGGADASPIAFTVTSLPAPTITSFTPVCGLAATSVVITGTNLIGVNYAGGSVKFGGVTATPTTVTPTTVTVLVPGGAATGPISVVSTSAAGSSGVTALSPHDFVVQAACALTLSTISPTSGAVGASVAMTGTNFPISTTCSVTFSSYKITTGTTNSAGTQITTTVPAGAVTGPVLVSCSTGAAAIAFTVTAGPTITSFTPTSGPVGTVVTITGTNFAGVSAVKFNGVNAPTFTVNSTTSITVTVPNAATTGKITVTTSAGTATSATNFTVSGTGGGGHPRTTTLKLGGALKVSGQVTSNDGFGKCVKYVPVKIQKQEGGDWKLIERLATNEDGAYAGFVPNKSGKYRAVAFKITLADGSVCGKDVSPTKSYSK